MLCFLNCFGNRVKPGQGTMKEGWGRADSRGQAWTCKRAGMKHILCQAAHLVLGCREVFWGLISSALQDMNPDGILNSLWADFLVLCRWDFLQLGNVNFLGLESVWRWAANSFCCRSIWDLSILQGKENNFYRLCRKPAGAAPLAALGHLVLNAGCGRG